jgi:hypothetical protein
MSAREQLRFEEDVRSVASSALSHYLARNPSTDGMKVLVRVMVRTVEQLTEPGRDAIRESLEEVRQGYRDNALQVHFEVVAGLADGYDVQCEPVARPGRSGLADGGQQDAVGDERLFALSFGGLRFDHMLESGSRWFPLMRPSDRRGGPGLVLPQSMAAVPHGPLIELRLAGDTLLMRRTWQRPEIAVSVNEVLLHPSLDAGLVVSAKGRIAYGYSTGGTECVLDYELADWAPAKPSPAGEPDRQDGSPHDVWFTVDSKTNLLRVAPPKAGIRPQDREFPIPSATPDRPIRYLDVQVLYTQGTRKSEIPDDWHVKIYRCATPQHADQLRRYLRTQAALIDRVNAAIGGTGQAPPWAIAPVTVLSAGTWYHGGQQATNMHTTEREVVDDPENRLSAWFGVPEQPQPHCYVIAVSPLLRGVHWADSTLRRGAPGVEQLPELMTLAEGIDRCHELDIAHCDIKPDNVCRYLRAGGGSGYVLIDGDAVAHTRGRIADLRLTRTYASPVIKALLRRSHDRHAEVDLRENDRFGFVLVTLAAVAGADRVAALLARDESGGSPIDSPEIVTRALATYWPEQWSAFAAALAAPFQYDALVGDDWTAMGWLTWLTQLSQPMAIQPQRVEPGRQVPHALPDGRYGRHVAEIRDEVRGVPRGLTAVVPAVVEAVQRHQFTVARKAYRETILVQGLLPLAFVVILLIGVILG